MRFCDFKRKQVINVCDCRRLGFVDDLEFNECTGQICAIVVREQSKWLWMFGCDCEYVIGWDKIVKIGPDIIMVDVCLEKVRKRN